MKLTTINRRWLPLALLLALLATLLLWVPTINRRSSGSTWSYAPDGYGAWYAYMEDQGVAVQRWQRPLAELLEAPEVEPDSILVRVMPQRLREDTPWPGQPELRRWLQAGHGLVLLAHTGTVTAAPFSTALPTDLGSVTVETRRRSQGVTPLLGDDYGGVAWKGTLDPQPSQASSEQPAYTLVATPFLGANAYQDVPGNFPFLAQLLQTPEGKTASVFIDEYYHGYQEADPASADGDGGEERSDTWLFYLSRTPLAIAAVQLGIILAGALLAQNRRPGPKRPLPPTETDNSTAYLKALSAVLHRANSQDFLVATLQQAEQRAVQRALGLGNQPLDPEALKFAWQHTTGYSASQLSPLEEAPRSSASSATLLTWLHQLQSLRTLATHRNQSHE